MNQPDVVKNVLVNQRKAQMRQQNPFMIKSKQHICYHKRTKTKVDEEVIILKGADRQRSPIAQIAPSPVELTLQLRSIWMPITTSEDHQLANSLISGMTIKMLRTPLWHAHKIA